MQAYLFFCHGNMVLAGLLLSLMPIVKHAVQYMYSSSYKLVVYVTPVLLLVQISLLKGP